MERIYIANQGDIPEIDEIRWLVHAISRRNNIALSGDPGHGKSSAIRYVASIMKKAVFSRNCQLHEQTYDYLGRPMLVNGRTEYSITQFKTALKQGGILINEETSEMPREIQKYLSTLLSDDYLDFVMLDDMGNERSLGYMRDNEGWDIENFIYTETFNPPKSNTGRDNFEFSHKSRVNPFNFRDLDSILSAYIAFERMGEHFSIPLIERGILRDDSNGAYIFTENREGRWSTSDGKTLSPEQTRLQETYCYFDRSIIEDRGVFNSLTGKLKGKGDFFYDFLIFLTALRGLVNPNVFSYDSLGERANRLLQEREKSETLSIVYPDQRVVTDGFRAYRDYLPRYGEKAARIGVTYDTLNRVLHGALKERELNNNSNQETFLRIIATEVGLLPRPEDGITL